ncbi:MAG: dihydroorotate dehydrogenase electron transfer subunit [Candidatus Bathyarchaeia archaeon]
MLTKLSAWLTAANKLRTTAILEINTISATVKTFTFQDKQCAKAKPGQFLMLWIPGVDEIPLSILDANEKEATISVAVKKVGEATIALHSRKVGDLVGLRGPFGNGFTAKTGKLLMVAGGVGVVPLSFLAKKLASKALKIVFIIGAKTKDELLFVKELKLLCGEENVTTVTEDGSCGVKGLASEFAKKAMGKEKFDMIYACGPELMARKVLDYAEKNGVSAEVSLERLMRCAIGICGSCMLGKYRVCREGPVFNLTRLKDVKAEFGVWKRDFDGEKIPV